MDALDFGNPHDEIRDFEQGIMIAANTVHERAAVRDTRPPLAREARWLDSTGKEIDLDDIDREYALNILCMVLVRRGRAGYSPADVRDDALVAKLREVVLTGREPNEKDRKRAKAYNGRNERRGLPYRAPTQ